MVQTNTTSQTTLSKKPQMGDGEFIQLDSGVSSCSQVAYKRWEQKITSLGIRCMAWLQSRGTTVYIELIYTPEGDYSVHMEREAEKKNGKRTERTEIRLHKSQGENEDQLKSVSPNLADDKNRRNHRR